MTAAKELERDWKPQIDIHCHILPAWDDGPADLEKSLAMIERAVAAGLNTIVATPHVGRKFKGVERPASEIAEGVANLQAEIDGRGWPMRIVPGAEVMLGEVDVRARIPVERALTYGGQAKFALVESPFPVWPAFGRSLVDAMLTAGVTPILAHPERYGDVQKDINILEPMVNQGALVQITAEALMGVMGKPLQNVCFALLRKGWVAFVASDAHSLREVLPSEAVDEVAKAIGEQAARHIFLDNPRRMLAGQRVHPAPPEKVASSGLLSRLFGR